MEQPEKILAGGTRIVTHAKLEPDGPFHMTTRRPGVPGSIMSVVGGYGGDVYHVRHQDETVGAYVYTEFELEK